MSLYWPWQQRWCPRRHQTRLSWYWAVSLVGCETCAPGADLCLVHSISSHHLWHIIAYKTNCIFKTTIFLKPIFSLKLFFFKTLFVFFPVYNLQRYKSWYWWDGARQYQVVFDCTNVHRWYVHLYTGKLLDHTLIEICGCCPSTVRNYGLLFMCLNISSYG